MRMRNSALLHGLWLTLTCALVLPGEALAAWGNENWGTMVWGQGASPPVLPALGIVGLTLLAMGLAATAAWTLRKSRPAVGATLILVVLAIPLAVAAGTIGELETFVNGTTADADQVNANFDAVETAVNDNDSRITAAQSTANTAVTNAAAAQSTANTAVTDAATAQGTADTAVTNAATAQTTADTAAAGHTVDTNTQLTNAQVAAAATAQGFVTGSHTTDTNTQLDEAAVDGFVANNGYADESVVAAQAGEIATNSSAIAALGVAKSLSTMAFPGHRDEIHFLDRRPVYSFLDTAGSGLQFNRGRIYITESGPTTTLQLAIYKLSEGASLGAIATYDDSVKIAQSNEVSWTDASGSASDGIGFVAFEFLTTVLNTTDVYFVGLFNSDTGPKYLGYHDAGDPARGLSGMFYISNSAESSPGQTMNNNPNTAAKGDPPWIRLYLME